MQVEGAATLVFALTKSYGATIPFTGIFTA